MRRLFFLILLLAWMVPANIQAAGMPPAGGFDSNEAAIATNSLTEKPSPDNDDVIAIYDSVAGTAKKVKWSTVAAGGHDAVTLAVSAAVLMDLSTQEISLDTQTANYIFAGPTTGAAAAPTFRAMVNADLGTALTPTFASLTASAGSSITLGTASSAAGAIIFKNATNANAFTVTSGVSGAAIGWTLPTAAPGGSNYLLNVDADGTMDYTDPATFEPALSAASQAEMEAGSEAGLRSMSPLRVSQAIAALAGGATTFDNIAAAGGAATLDLGAYTHFWTIGTAFRLGSGANYVEFLPGYARMAGTYYIEGGTLIPALSSDGQYAGTTRTYTVDSGETNTIFGQVMAIMSDGELEAADADHATAAYRTPIGVLAEAGTGSKKLLTYGEIREDDWNWTIGGEVYLSTAPGTTCGLTQTLPERNPVWVIGVATSADSIFVDIKKKEPWRHRQQGFNPASIGGLTTPILPLGTVGDEAPNGIIIGEWKLSFDADPTAELAADFKYADAQIGLANAAVIDVVDTTNGVSSEDTDANINSGNPITNGKFMYLHFDSAYSEAGHSCSFEWWERSVE